ncbi:hypothetical protein B7P43_G15080 [Cryptotermes secundus]|uniref:Uncharacterized protein n=1 Tax=Cryptotermes secundus TaxID=105785 RepID=A0A2J7Q444_9NEOP|nr:hypothetical protein B7P43_G15080 [Cryptotermes secundus]
MFITKSMVTSMNNKYACSAYYQQIMAHNLTSTIFTTLTTSVITRYTISPILPEGLAGHTGDWFPTFQQTTIKFTNMASMSKLTYLR